MRICIYGAGAVGSHFAARLANAGQQVSVIARGPQLQAIAERGITVHTGGEIVEARVSASEDPRAFGEQDLVIVTLKGPALPRIVEPVQALLGAHTPIIFAMNGIMWWYFYGLDARGQERRLAQLDPGERWWNEVGPERVIGGVVYSANEVIAPGVIEHRSTGRNELRIAELDGSDSARVAEINDVLAGAGMSHPVADIRATLWEKLLANISYGPIACLTGATITEILANPELRQMATDVMNEAIATARALGTELGVSAEERIANTRSSGHKPSILQDLELGRPMEIDAIAGVPQIMARDLGVPTPNLDRVVALLKERGRIAEVYPRA